MDIKIVSEKYGAAKKASFIVLKEIKKNPSIVLGLATGETMIPFYNNLILELKKKEISFENIRTFNLDEYVGISRENKNSFFYFMKKNLFSKINLKPINIHFLYGNKTDFKKECHRYEENIKNLGGIDLTILGIGRNGHIGFNEPGSSFNSRTRKVRLSKLTREDNKRSFNFIENVPRYALTMGIKTILESRKIILIASGKNKSDAIYASIKGKINKSIPASALRNHNHVSFIIDRLAASKIIKS